MQEINPYQASDGQTESTALNKRLGAMIGFVLGAALPVGLGSYQYLQFSAYIDSLPPDVVAYNMPAASALILIVLGGPVGGFSGAAIGSVAAATINWLSPSSTQQT